MNRLGEDGIEPVAVCPSTMAPPPPERLLEPARPVDPVLRCWVCHEPLTWRWQRVERG